MSSPYAQKGSSGGSAYASTGTPGGSAYAGTGSPGAPAPPKQQGGVMGWAIAAAHTLMKPVDAVGNYVGQQGMNVGEGLYGIGAGAYKLGATEVGALKHDVQGKNTALNKAEWSDLLHGHLGRMVQEPAKFKGASSPEAQLAGIETGMAHQYTPAGLAATVKSGNLFNIATTLLPLLGGGAGIAGRVADSAGAAVASDASTLGKVGTIAKVAVRGTEPGVRTLKLPQLVGPQRVGEIPAHPIVADALGTDAASLQRGYAAHLKAQAVTGAKPLTFKKYSAQLLKTPLEGPANLSTTAIQLNQGQSYLSRGTAKLHDVAVQRALDKVPMQEGNTPLIARYGMVRGAKSLDETGQLTASLRAQRVAEIDHAPVSDTGLTKQEGRLALHLVSGKALPEEMSPVWKAAGTPEASTLADTAASLQTKGVLKLEGNRVVVNAEKFPALAKTAETMGAGQGIRSDTIAKRGWMTDAGMANRENIWARIASGAKLDKKTGEWAGGNPEVYNQIASREGGGFVSLKTSVRRQPQGPFARTMSKVISRTKKPSLGPIATGEGLRKGLIPAEPTKMVARSLRETNRHENTATLRDVVASHGSDVRMSDNDVLVAASDKAAALPTEIKQIVGREENTLTAQQDHTLKSYFDGEMAKLKNPPPLNEHPLGVRAPEGHKWVNKSLVPASLKSTDLARGGIEKALGKVSTSVTGLTVYFKPGHVPQRLVTNLSANVIHGSADPLEWRKSLQTLDKMTAPDRRRLGAATGVHGYQSLPIEGEGKIARVTGAGATWFSKHVDAHFRQNAALYELRKVGYDTPAKITKALDAIEHGGNLPGNELMKIAGALRRANRGAMDYSTNPTERRTIQRALWFYGFGKAATRFAGHTVAEHPGKAAIIGNIGQEGQKYTKGILGNVPSYEGGLVPFGGKSKSPLVFDPSTLIPTGTVAAEAEGLANPVKWAVGSLNPLYAGGAKAASDALESKGSKTTAKDFFGQAFAPTPELQALTAATSPKKDGGSTLLPTSSKYLFGSTWQSTLARSVGGAALTPRRVNLSKLNADYLHEHQKKRTITIYSP